MKAGRMSWRLAPLAGALGVIVYVSPSAAARQNIPSEPAAARFVYDDLRHFAEALKSIQGGTASREAFETHYFGRATNGLKALVARKGVSAAGLAKAFDERPAAYASIPALPVRLASLEPAMRKAFARLEEIYPQAVFPPTYFAVSDPIFGGGLADPVGLLIAFGARETDDTVSRIPHLVAHELTHIQQAVAQGVDTYRAIYGPSGSLLAIAIREGSADFIAQLISGEHINPRAHAYGLAHEKALWEQFRSVMHGTDTLDWMFRTPANGAWPQDLGYFIGYRIAERYYANAADKAQAIREIMSVTDYRDFLQRSGYNPELSAWLVASGDQFRERIDAYLRSSGAGPYNGVVFVQRPGAPPVEAAYGVADADLSVPLTTSMRFGIGSLTKPITAVAVMRLVEKGRLSKSDRICKFMNPCPATWAPVTLEHLLSHTSGIPDLFTELPAAPVEQTRKIIDEAIAKRMADGLSSGPGERYAYSNFGYFLLGYALESSTGMLWADVVRREVLAPAGMTETEYDDVWSILPGRVRGYARDERGLRHIRYRDHASYAAGGLLSTLRDLVAFDDALVSGALVSAATLRDMTTPRLGDYGLGWQMICVHGRAQRNHSGGTNGFSSHFARYEDGTRVVVLSNVEGAALAKAVACDLAAIAFGTTPAQRPSVEVSCRAS